VVETLPTPFEDSGRATREGWGRALGREQLDTLLLRQAARAGVDVRQPWAATALVTEGPDHRCTACSENDGTRVEFTAKVIVAAHGSWEPGRLPSHLPRRRARPADLLGFKAHFDNCDLPAGLMPLLAFPGGYGGMVHTDGGRVSLSCCIRRDQLDHLRGESRTALLSRPDLQDGSGEPSYGQAPPAGEVVLEHIKGSCLGVRKALAGATRLGIWLAAGPIRPGIRTSPRPGLFLVGNCAGEAHPVVAEGISMAIQSSWLLAQRLLTWKGSSGSVSDLARVESSYAAAWRRAFAPRVYAAEAVAQWAMRPALVAGVMPFLRSFPGLISWGARLSGKATTILPRLRKNDCHEFRHPGNGDRGAGNGGDAARGVAPGQGALLPGAGT
jgi:flavin-dependent dehydrogenase